MNVLLKQREIAYYLGDSQASVLIAWDGFAGRGARPGRRVRVSRVGWSVRASSAG